MGVFTVGRQVALEIDMPGWWLANASVDLDFRRGLYYDSSTANPRAATDFLSCTRASVGYAKNADGTLTSFASNTLRIGTNGLLVEDARTNSATFSQDLSSWSVNHNCASPTSATAPDGTSTANKIIADAVSTSHYFRQDNGAVGTSAAYTMSFFMKAGEHTYGWMQIAPNNAGSRYTMLVNLSTGGIVDTFTSGTPGATGATVEAFGSGWWRLSVTANLVTGTNNYFYAGSGISASLAANDSPVFAGDSSSGIYVWGGQVELGSFLSSYIPTTGAAATRAAENIITSGSLQTAINAATGSLVAQTDNGGGAGFAANIVDSNATNLLGFNSSNNALASVIAPLATANTGNRTTQDKLGLAWNPSGRSLVLNGGTVATDASAQTPSATQHIGSTGTTNFAYAYVERISAFTTKLADATLQGFTV